MSGKDSALSDIDAVDAQIKTVFPPQINISSR